jgi:hypothetical protein
MEESHCHFFTVFKGSLIAITTLYKGVEKITAELHGGLSAVWQRTLQM